MRVVLSILVFDMVFRSLVVVVPWENWADDLAMESMPVRLSTQEEFAELFEKARKDDADGVHPVIEDVGVTLDSIWDFLKPWPARRTRKHLDGADDWGKWSVVWLATRLEFAEHLVGTDQQWPMFAPNVRTRKWMSRARLTFADGSEIIVRQRADPEDLLDYSHWFEEKILDYELHVRDRETDVRACNGYCNLLAHRNPTNAAGSPLVTIRLFEVYYDFPAPGMDATEFLRRQTGPPDDQIRPDYLIYDVATGKGTRLLRPD